MKQQSRGEDDLFRPRFGRRQRVDRDRMPTLRGGLLRWGGSTQGGRVAVREPRANARRCVIKARFVPARTHVSKANRMHLDYLERDGVERDGSPGRLYGADEDFERDEFRAPIEGEERQFRFIVSPEDGDALDLTAFTRRFMAQVERDLGRRLIWAAVNHHNTDNPHIHIVVRGVDQDGADLRIDRRYISQEIRWRARELVTRELGPRPEFEFSNRKMSGVEDERLTEIDRLLVRRIGADRVVSLPELLSAPGDEGRRCIARLHTLGQFGLAQEEPAGVWKLSEGWTDSLARLGAQRDLLDRLHPIVGEKAVDYSRLDPSNPVPSFEGTVVGMGLDNELTGQMFAAVETNDGRGFYVPLQAEVAAALRTGQTVRAQFRAEPWLKPSDRIIARFAQENGWYYDPPRHQKALETLPVTSREPSTPTAAARISANIRRLERLAAYHLVTRMPDGRWRIPPDLLPTLESREKTHPRARLRVEPLHAAERHPALGNGADDERLMLGRSAAERLRLTFVPHPSRFRGRLFPAPPGPSGAEYVRVVDDGRREFTLVAKPKDAERLRGRVVIVSRDHYGRLSIRTTPEISR